MKLPRNSLTADAIADLATGYRAITESGTGYDGDTHRLALPTKPLRSDVFNWLVTHEYINRLGELTDKGRIAYLKSTDEMGDGFIEVDADFAP